MSSDYPEDLLRRVFLVFIALLLLGGLSLLAVRLFHTLDSAPPPSSSTQPQ